ncbi:YxlC family protein [Bacillus sp. JJ1609]|uniref:YxlC family protein n=1 Tax=Bacillus sp. JJ1609 TaxID=3122977 RepID=UPI0030004249
MTDRNEISPNDDLLDKELFETISQLNEGLGKLDSLDTYSPGEQWFEQIVLSQQEQIQKKYRRELGWFILSAVLILSGVIFTLMEIPQLFLILQVAAVAVSVIYSYKGAQKQVEGK